MAFKERKGTPAVGGSLEGFQLHCVREALRAYGGGPGKCLLRKVGVVFPITSNQTPSGFF